MERADDIRGDPAWWQQRRCHASKFRSARDDGVGEGVPLVWCRLAAGLTVVSSVSVFFGEV